jgi:hypothetical protein
MLDFTIGKLMAEYFTSDLEHSISRDALRDADHETQLEVMETWFRQHFEDPVERTPYESAEGGFIWIWGGPYNAREELEDEFSGVVPNDVIDELVKILDGECWEWSPAPTPEDYDDYIVEDIAQITEYHRNFTEAILDIKKLLKTKVDGTVVQCFCRLLYVNVITALETYLSDAFITTVVNRPEWMRKFIETTPEFQAEKIPLSEVFKAIEEIERKARSYLIDVVWHNLARVKPMYQSTMGIKFPSDSGVIFLAILTRHDIVHRNGKTKEGKEIALTPKQVADLVAAVEKFVEQIDFQLAEVRSPNKDVPPTGGIPAS